MTTKAYTLFFNSLFGIIFSAGVAHADAHLSLKAEEADSLLHTLYNRSQVLALAVSDHSGAAENFAAPIISQIGKDPSLKYIALELPNDLQYQFDALSVMSEVDAVEKFKRAGIADDQIESGMRWSRMSTIAPILEVVRELNRSRLSDPISIEAIDHLSYQAKPGLHLDHEEASVRCDNITISSIFHFNRETMTHRREVKTATNFHSVFKRNLGRKGLIIYHQAHLSRELTACGAYHHNNGSVSVYRGPLAWLHHAAQRLGPFGLSVVLFDTESRYNPNGILRTTDELRTSPIANQSKVFGYSTSELSVQLENILEPESYLNEYRRGTIDSQVPVNKVYDAVIALD